MSSNFVKPGPGWPDNDVDIGKTYAAVQEVFAHLSAQVLYFFLVEQQKNTTMSILTLAKKYLAVLEVFAHLFAHLSAEVLNSLIALA